MVLTKARNRLVWVGIPTCLITSLAAVGYVTMMPHPDNVSARIVPGVGSDFRCYPQDRNNDGMDESYCVDDKNNIEYKLERNPET